MNYVIDLTQFRDLQVATIDRGQLYDTYYNSASILLCMLQQLC